MLLPPPPRMTRLDWVMAAASGCAEVGAMVWYLRRRFWRLPR